MNKGIKMEDLIELVRSLEVKEKLKNYYEKEHLEKKNFFYLSYVYDLEHAIIYNEKLTIFNEFNEIFIIESYFDLVEKVIKKEIQYIVDDIDDLKFVYCIYLSKKENNEIWLHNINSLTVPLIDSALFFSMLKDKISRIEDKNKTSSFDKNVITSIKNFKKILDKYLKDMAVFRDKNINSEFLVKFVHINNKIYYK
jgi:hypothetical protein